MLLPSNHIFLEVRVNWRFLGSLCGPSASSTPHRSQLSHIQQLLPALCRSTAARSGTADLEQSLRYQCLSRQCFAKFHLRSIICSLWQYLPSLPSGRYLGLIPAFSGLTHQGSPLGCTCRFTSYTAGPVSIDPSRWPCMSTLHPGMLAKHTMLEYVTRTSLSAANNRSSNAVTSYLTSQMQVPCERLQLLNMYWLLCFASKRGGLHLWPRELLNLHHQVSLRPDQLAWT